MESTRRFCIIIYNENCGLMMEIFNVMVKKLTKKLFTCKIQLAHY